MKSYNNFRCVVYEKLNSDTDQKISWKWKTIDLSNIASYVAIYPKSEFSNPDYYTFTVKCYGGTVPNNGASSSNSMYA